MKKKELSKAEWIVMNAVWQLQEKDREVAVSELLPVVREKRDWHTSTLKTTMDRLVEKGYLKSRVRGKTCFYTSSAPRQKVVRSCLTSLLDDVLDGAFTPLVAYLADKRDLNDDQIEELEALLELGEGDE